MNALTLTLLIGVQGISNTPDGTIDVTIDVPTMSVPSHPNGFTSSVGTSSVQTYDQGSSTGLKQLPSYTQTVTSFGSYTRNATWGWQDGYADVEFTVEFHGSSVPSWANYLRLDRRRYMHEQGFLWNGTASYSDGLAWLYYGGSWEILSPTTDSEFASGEYGFLHLRETQNPFHTGCKWQAKEELGRSPIIPRIPGTNKFRATFSKNFHGEALVDLDSGYIRRYRPASANRYVRSLGCQAH